MIYDIQVSLTSNLDKSEITCTAKSVNNEKLFMDNSQSEVSFSFNTQGIDEKDWMKSAISVLVNYINMKKYKIESVAKYNDETKNFEEIVIPHSEILTPKKSKKK